MEGYPEAEVAGEQQPDAVDAADFMRPEAKFPQRFKVIPFLRSVAYDQAERGLRPGFLRSARACGAGCSKGAGSMATSTGAGAT